MRHEARQTNIYDFIEDKDWIDRVYYVWKCYHKNDWTEYSPKYLTKEDAKEWRMTLGEQLCDRFGRKLKLFTKRPSDHPQSYYVDYMVGDEAHKKLVPGEDFFDACDNLRLFMPEVTEIGLGFKNK